VLLRVAQDGGPADYRAFRNTQAVLLTSRTVAAAALRQPGVADLALVKAQKDPVAWLLERLDADFPRDAEVLRLRLRVDDPAAAAALLNAVADAYLEEVVQKPRADHLRRVEALKVLSDRSAAALSDRRRLLKEYTALEARQQFAAQQLAWSQRELLQVQSEARKLRAELAVRLAAEKKAGEDAPPDIIVAELVDLDPSVRELSDQVRQLQKMLEDVKSLAASGDDSPAVKDLKKHLLAAQQAL
jgi:hypothetical protein